MPRVTTGNTMAPCVVIGERAGAMLNTEHKFNTKVGGRGAILFGAVVFAAIAVGLHTAQGQTQPSAPETLKPPAGEYLRAHAHASGQQFYTCDGSKWILSGPDAQLFDEAWKKGRLSFRRAYLAMVGRQPGNRQTCSQCYPRSGIDSVATSDGDGSYRRWRHEERFQYPAITDERR